MFKLKERERERERATPTLLRAKPRARVTPLL
jgi:hypothetical protein